MCVCVCVCVLAFVVCVRVCVRKRRRVCSLSVNSVSGNMVVQSKHYYYFLNTLILVSSYNTKPSQIFHENTFLSTKQTDKANDDRMWRCCCCCWWVHNYYKKTETNKRTGVLNSRYIDWTACRSSCPFSAIVEVSDVLNVWFGFIHGLHLANFKTDCYTVNSTK